MKNRWFCKSKNLNYFLNKSKKGAKNPLKDLDI